MSTKVEQQVGRLPLSIESGRIARQADGSALVRYGDTVILATAVSSQPREGIDFFPLSVDYREMTYAAGKFPGGFFKREGRPSTKEIITMRLIDRPIRPLFPEAYRNEVQVMCVVLSADKENDPDVLSMIGASAALSISSIPFSGPIGAVRVGRIGGEFVVNPTRSELVGSDIDLVVAGTEEEVTMVEAGCKEASEADVLAAIRVGHDAIRTIVAMIRDLTTQCGKSKQEVPDTSNPELEKAVKDLCLSRVREANSTPGKLARQEAMFAIKRDAVEKLAGGENPRHTKGEVLRVLDNIEGQVVRSQILSDSRRADGRTLHEVRPITIEIGVLPRTHGSAVFTRGETQALVVTTLGTADDEQIIDGLVDEYTKRFILHYNFPPFSVNEVKPVRGPSRRDIGHGCLAERALEPVIPPEEAFPYTIRLVSDIMESNGSSSMATVCGGTLSLMDAGVPIERPIAGVAMGMVKEGSRYVILTDIQGGEDHYGDMDFKVAGSQSGITALQMDIKVTGVSFEILEQALGQAHEARLEILRKMLAVINRPRTEVSMHAPRLVRMIINTEKIGALIGPGGRVIRGIQEDTGATIEVDDDGVVVVSAPSQAAVEEARSRVEMLTQGVKVGATYDGTVVSLKEFGAFIELYPGQDGLCHISELSDKYVKKPDDVVKIGDKLRVKVLAVDDQGRVKLSRKAVLQEEAGK